jgi:Concanavalin A-like lectin/glucanases superfamily/Fibronectin type III domain
MRFRLPTNHVRARHLLAPLLVVAALGGAVPSLAQAAPMYPDLQTLPPRDLRFARTDVSFDGSGQFHNVLRFTNTVWNSGDGKLETRGLIDPATRTGPAVQRVFDTDGSFTEYGVGNFYWHAQNHQHYHYDDWGRYELWDKPDYDAWLASGRTQGQADLRGTKTTSCVMDEEFIKQLPATPFPAVYPSDGCLPNNQNVLVQGLSRGWGDTYDYYRDEQWIDLDQGSLANGQYVLRSVTDPNNKVYESPGKADIAKESPAVNEGIVVFTVQNGQIVDTSAPTGTVAVNNVDARTTSKNVTLKVTGRDDVSGVDQVRVSADGVNWRTHNYTSSGSTPTAILCDLTDPAIGGSPATGERTLYTQFHDRSGKWGPTESDTIVYEGGAGAPSAYSNAVLADSPAGYWRLGEAGGTTANDSAGSNTGDYTNAPQLDSPSLLPADTANRSVRFDGTDDHVGVPNSTSLNPSQQVTVEAWIKPEALPAAGSFGSIATKGESYSLQFNGPRLEFTVMQAGVRKRTQAPVGAIAVNQTYHVVGTYDGANARLYVNGSQVAVTALTGAIGPATKRFVIGSWSGTGEFVRGTIDDVAVYGSALSAARVAAHYEAATNAGPPPDPTVAAPSSLSAIAASQTQVELRWNDNATNETEYILERDTTSAFSSPHTTPLNENETAYSDTGLSPATQYYYRVRALNVGATSAWSNVATATTPAVPPPPPTGYGQTVLTDDPLSYWRLDDPSGPSAVDQRAINPGLYANGAVQGAPGLLGSDSGDTAVALDGVNDHVSVSNSTSLSGLSSLITLEAWIKPTSLPAAGSFASVVTKAESYSLQFNGPRLELTIMQFGARQRLQAPVGAIVAGQTYHVVGTFDGSTRRLYVNGAEVANAPLTGGATASSNGLFIGSWNGSSELFGGTIDEVAVYGKALSPARVAAHYSDGAGTPPPPVTVAAPSGLTATATSTTQINLQWTDNATNETEYVVERDTSSAFASPQATVLGANATTRSDTGLTPATQYFYRVRARNATATSAWSNVVSATTQSTPTPPPTGYAATVLADNPVSHWRLGETTGTVAADQRAANPGAYVNAPVLGAPSLLGSDTVNKAITLDGTNDHVRMNNSTSLSITGAITLEAWIKPTSLPAAGSFASIVSKPESYALQFNGPRLEFTIIQSGTRRRLQAPLGAIAAGQTYHVVATFDGSIRRLYVNGVSVASGALVGGATATTNRLFVGSWGGTREYLRGTVDDVAIYRTAVSSTRVLAHYNAGK